MEKHEKKGVGAQCGKSCAPRQSRKPRTTLKYNAIELVVLMSFMNVDVQELDLVYVSATEGTSCRNCIPLLVLGVAINSVEDSKCGNPNDLVSGLEIYAVAPDSARTNSDKQQIHEERKALCDVNANCFTVIMGVSTNPGVDPPKRTQLQTEKTKEDSADVLYEHYQWNWYGHTFDDRYWMIKAGTASDHFYKRVCFNRNLRVTISVAVYWTVVLT
ncbi:hypothetical protein CLF_106598 [Clonorchis sinensis]|uniref:Uncharacterized protein n=1 Tax=Clonorchis sinensis TaxID=79923 RepID=G7YQ26_CLOSI|nr:hypothetical protein CLF_106598 [Clonorchis sinensis]